MRLAFVFVAAAICCALAQDKPATPDAPKPPAAKGPRPAPKNLKVLKEGTTGDEVSLIMRTFTIGLGVQCNFCHIQGNFASDENPKKEVARRMIKMTHDVNGLFPVEGTGAERKMRVSCYTCHRGEAEPKTAPMAAVGGR